MVRLHDSAALISQDANDRFPSSSSKTRLRPFSLSCSLSSRPPSATSLRRPSPAKVTGASRWVSTRTTTLVPHPSPRRTSHRVRPSPRSLLPSARRPCRCRPLSLRSSHASSSYQRCRADPRNPRDARISSNFSTMRSTQPRSTLRFPQPSSAPFGSTGFTFLRSTSSALSKPLATSSRLTLGRGTSRWQSRVSMSSMRQSTSGSETWM